MRLSVQYFFRYLLSVLAEFRIFLRDGMFNCESMVAVIIKPQPTSSLSVKTSLSIKNPPITAKTDSKLKIKDATTGEVFFCPAICNV